MNPDIIIDQEPLPEQNTRAFIAACLDRELLAKVEEQQQRLIRHIQSEDVRWTNPEQIHLTFRFLGSVPAAELSLLGEAMGRAAARCAGPLGLSIQGYGCFPSFQLPKVIWLGLHGETASLADLQVQLQHETARFGSHDETRAFHPHLTLARVRARGKEARRIGESMRTHAAPEPLPWTIRELTLMKSQLSPKGSIYTPLAHAPLGEPSR